ncbi:MAG: CoA transferase [Pseudomonadota bacterium]
MKNEAALTGIRVIAFTHFAAGPIAAQYLGALGADVIKIESPNRDLNRHAVRDLDDTLDGVSPYYLCTNRNQRCVVLNLKSEGGREVARKLIASSDVVLENYRPGVLDKLSLGYDSARELKDDIVYCSFSAYDALGPGRDRPGQDLIMQAVSGLASLSGSSGGPPVPVGAYLIDGFTAMQGVIGILAALRYRDATGQGQWLRADMMSTALYMMTQEASFVMNASGMDTRSSAGVAHIHQGAPYGIYRAKDGDIAISVFGGGDVPRALAQALGVEADIADYLSENGLKEHRDEVAGAFSIEIAKLTVDEAIARLSPTGAWVVPVRTLGEALDDSVAVSANTIRTYSTPNVREHRIVTEPLQMSQSPLRRDVPAPAYAEHSVELLNELGYDATETAKLIESGDVVSAES